MNIQIDTSDIMAEIQSLKSLILQFQASLEKVTSTDRITAHELAAMRGVSLRSVYDKAIRLGWTNYGTPKAKTFSLKQVNSTWI